MGSLKMLKCPFKRTEGSHQWHNQQNKRLDEELRDYYVATVPIVGRDGWFYQKGKSWYEFEGKGYMADANSFLYALELSHMNDYSVAEYNSLKQLERLNSKLLTEKQRKFLDTYEMYLEFKKKKAQTLVDVKKMKKRILEKKSKLVDKMLEK